MIRVSLLKVKPDLYEVFAFWLTESVSRISINLFASAPTSESGLAYKIFFALSNASQMVYFCINRSL